MIGSDRRALRLIVACGLLVGGFACSDGDVDQDAGTTADSETDTGGPLFQPGDTADDASADQPDAGGTAPDVAQPADGGGETSVGGGKFNEDCKSNDDCDSKHCIFTPAGLKCSDLCNGACPSADFSCLTVGTDTFCVWKWGHLCEPCTTNKACFAHGQAAAACVDRGDSGSFCGVLCASDTQCPAAYKCKTAKDVDGKDVQQCLPAADQFAGECACSVWAASKQLATTCKAVSGFGACTGTRACSMEATKAVLGACDAPTPATESCDALDNDCDGQTDENACDDGEFCTTTSCLGAAGCKIVNKVGTCDADGSECTTADECESGKCKAGAQLNCNDNNPCTQDACDPAKGCVFKSIAAPCDADNNPCTVADTCKDGNCKPGDPKPCASGQPCVIGACSIASGKCKFADKDGLACDDGNACSTGGKCAGELCKSSPVECDDGNACSIDSCDAVTGCAHKSSSAVCDDGNACTSSDGCVASKCVGLPVNVTKDCNDNNPCTKIGCDPNSKKQLGCTAEPLSGPCDDNNACTAKDECKGGKCTPGANACKCKTNSDCDNNNPCTDDSCVSAGGKLVCKSVAIDKLACDADGDKCTEDDVCGNGKCHAGDKKNCNDANACTADSCDAKLACKHVVQSGSCDDGDPCTVGDLCVSSGAGKVACKAGKSKDCDDKIACTVDTCEAKSGGCKHVSALGKALPCYGGDKKKAGVGACKKGTQTCKADGTLGPCNGDVLPKASETCGNGVDDDCDGATDQGCAPTTFFGRFVPGGVSGKAGKMNVRGVVGGSLATGRFKSGKWTVGLGLYEWLMSQY